MGARFGITIFMDRKNWKRNFVVTKKGCWLWKYGKPGNVYKQFGRDGYHGYVHRYAYKLFKGEIPENREVAHSCDMKRCGNPKHIFAKTRQQNMAEAWERRIDRKKMARIMRRSSLKLWRTDKAFRERKRRSTSVSMKKYWAQQRAKKVP